MRERARSWLCLSRRRRGFSLIEAMAASAILAIGILGALEAIIVVTRTNVMAKRRAQATSIASQTRAGLEARHWTGLDGTGLLFDSGNCDNSGLAVLSGGLATASSVAPVCAVDLDAFDAAAAQGDKIIPEYLEAGEDPGTFRRVVVRTGTTGDAYIPVVVVVSWGELGGRQSHKQLVGFYDMSQNGASAEF